MKLASLLVLFALGLSVVSCQKEAPAPVKEFYIKANQDGQAWITEGSWGTYVKSENRIYFGGSEEVENQEEENLLFEVSYADLKKDALIHNFKAELLFLIGGDGITNRFQHVTPSEGDWIKITELDTTKRIIEGEFAVTLKRNSFYTQENEYIAFKNGKFRVQYSDRD